jgi:hypothetical protein
MKAHLLVLLASVLVSAAFLQPAFAEGMRKSSSGGSVDVLVEPVWPEGDNQTQFNVSFLAPGTDNVEPHAWFDLKILDSDGKTVFSITQAVSQNVFHSAEGHVTVPVKLENGSYTIHVDVLGTPGSPQFIPITTETVDFNITVTPEFPVGMLGLVAAVVSGTIVATRLKMKA